jgi:hypothetical protein
MRRPRLLSPTVIMALALAGCGGSHQTTVSQTQPATSQTTRPATTPAALEQAVREAITKDHTLSREVLWTNRVPVSTPATAGPALAVLRTSVAQRRSQGVRVKTLSENFRILSVQLEPSYAAATAMIVDDQRVQPSYPSGRPRGRSVTLNERVRIELHRIGGSQRFVVWKVVLLP